MMFLLLVHNSLYSQRLVRQLSKIAGNEVNTADLDVPQLISKFNVVVEEADAATKNPIIILIDALDEMETENNAHELEWLPLTFPPNIRFIVSTTEQSVVNSRAFDILRIASMSRAVLQEIMDKQLKNFAGKVGFALGCGW